MPAAKNRPPGLWKKGTSGNPKGRPPGSGDVAKIRAAISASVPAILAQLTTAALAGDVSASRLLLDRAVAPLKAVEVAAPLALPDGTPTEQGRAVMAAVAAGELAPGQGAALLAALGVLVRLIEADELARRLHLIETALKLKEA